MRLVDTSAYVWAEAVAIPLPGFEEAARTDGQIAESRATLMVLIGTPPGTHFLHSGVYSHSRREVLGYFTMPSDGDRVIVTRLAGMLATARPSVEHELNAKVSPEISLLGFDLLDNIYTLSDDNWLTLYWQADADVGTDYVIGVQLVDPDGKEIAYWLGRPVTSGYPTSEWITGEIIRDPWLLKLPPAVLPGDYELRLTLFDGETGLAVNQLTLGEVPVAERPRSFDVPVMQNIVSAHLGDWIMLLGYDLFAEPVTGGGRLQVALYWQAQTAGTDAYTVFVHLIGPDGRVVAQHDGPPAAGAIPTNEWAKGEVVIDKHLVEFGQLPSGTYQIVVGMYDPSTMARLPILAANGSAVDGLLLENIEIR